MHLIAQSSAAHKLKQLPHTSQREDAMGFFDFLSNKKSDSKSKRATAVVSQDELKRLVWDAIDRNHLVEFETLCAENEDEVMRVFAEWKKAPEYIRTDKDAMRKYAYTLMVIASYFQKQRNRGELMTMLTGIDDSEYSRKWQEQLGQCQMLMQQQLKFDEALPLLEQCLDLASGVSGAGVDKFLPLTLGFIGECYFQLGNMEKATEYVERALQCTTMQGDYEASVAYLSNLYEISRYAGDKDKAASCAQTIADKAFDRSELVTASNWRQHAKAVKDEPLHRLVLKIGDELFELDEIPKVKDERVEFIFARNRLELVLCTQKCFEGRELTTQGKYDEALHAFEEAAKLDKYSPQPWYMSGNIKLAGRRYEEAVADLEKVEELCPGFETSRADLWLARQLASNVMEHDACRVVYESNSEGIPLDQRIQICRDMIEKYPKFGEAHWRLAKFLIESGNTDEAVGSLMSAAQAAEDEDVLARTYRDLAVLSLDDEDKRKYFNKAIALKNGNVLAQAISRYMLRQLDSE